MTASVYGDYTSPDQVRLSSNDGNSVSSSIPPTRSGISTVILPKSSSVNSLRKRARSPKFEPGEVVIDPEYPDSFRLNLNDLEHETVVREFNNASGEQTREIVHNTFKSLNQLNSAKSNPSLFVDKRGLLDNQQQEDESTEFDVSGEESEQEKEASIMSQVQLRPSRTTRTESSKPNPVKRDRPEAQAPTKKVTFELAGFGTFTASYHHVVLDGDDDSRLLVLVYDNNYTVGGKFFPDSNDNALLVDVHDMPSVFKVRSAGLRYRVGNLEHCVLLIENSAPKDSEEVEEEVEYEQ